MYRAARIAAAFSMFVLAAGSVAWSATETQNLPIVCTATGPVSLWSDGTTIHWSVAINGRCENGGDWILVSANGSGTSADCEQGQLKNLHLDMTVTYSPVFLPEAVSGVGATTRQELWHAKTAPSSLLTPFLVAEGGKSVGAGNIGYRIAGSCTAKTALTFRWIRNSPMNVLPIACAGPGTLALGPAYGSGVAWGLSGSGVCERGDDVWDVVFDGSGGSSDDLGLCDDSIGGLDGWHSGFSVWISWANRTTGATGGMWVYWNVLDPEPVPFSIRHLDGIITTDPADGCWVKGRSYAAEFRFVVLPVTTSI